MRNPRFKHGGLTDTQGRPKGTLRYCEGYRPTTGSRQHPHLKVSQWKPYYVAARRFVLAQLRRKDRDTLLMKAEAEQVLSALYVRPQTIRNGSPQERADAILANVYTQLTQRRYWPNNCPNFPASLQLVCRMMAVDICLKHSGFRPTLRQRYRWVQLARSCFKHILRADRRYYVRDDGHGHVSTVEMRYRYQLQSHNVCKRMVERLERVFKWYVHDHGNSIASLVLNPHPAKYYDLYTPARKAARWKGSLTAKRNRRIALRQKSVLAEEVR
jgi:hypothetical protein